MANLTAEQIEQKKQLLAEKVKEMKAIYNELVEAGAIELSDEDLDTINGGGKVLDWIRGLFLIFDFGSGNEKYYDKRTD